MSNMSYCRYQNTYQDLLDCLNDLEERINNEGKDDYDQSLSTSELNYCRWLVEVAEQIVEIKEAITETIFENEDED